MVTIGAASVGGLMIKPLELTDRTMSLMSRSSASVVKAMTLAIVPPATIIGIASSMTGPSAPVVKTMASITITTSLVAAPLKLVARTVALVARIMSLVTGPLEANANIDYPNGIYGHRTIRSLA